MIELYIDNNKIDLRGDIEVIFNYKLEDTNQPTSTKNNYTKTVSIPKTPNNIRVFGFSNLLNIKSGFSLLDRHYYKLINNALLLESGYIVVDTLDDNNFNCTLYGNLGDFFSKLQYKSDGKDLSFSDLHLGLKNPQGQDYLDEDTDTLFTLNSTYVSHSWSWLINNLYSDRINRFAVPIPLYNGNYSDFSSDKVVFGVGGAEQDIKDIVGTQGQYHTNVLLTLPREIAPFEAQEFRANRLKIGFPINKMLDLIVNYSTNYNVTLSEGITNSEVYKKGYILRDEIEFDEVEKETKPLSSDAKIGYNYQPSTTLYTSTFSTLGFESPRYSFSYNIGIHTQSSVEGLKLSRKVNYFEVQQSGSQGKRYIAHTAGYIYGGYIIEITPQYLNNGTWRDTTTKKYILWGDVDENSSPSNLTYPSGNPNVFNFGGEKCTYTQALTRKYGINVSEYSPLYTSFKSQDGVDWTSQNEKGVVNGDFPIEVKNQNVRIKYFIKKIQLTGIVDPSLNCLDDWDFPSKDLIGEVGTIGNKEGTTFTYTPQGVGSVDSTAFNSSDIFSIYDGTSLFNNKTTSVTKKQLFEGMGTPYKYLIGIVKAYNWRFVVEDMDITIMTNAEYFTGEQVNIDNLIDRQQVTTKPILSDYKYLDYGFENLDTYCDYLYKKKYGENEKYGHLLFDTKSNINSEVNDKIEDGVFKQISDYNQLSNCNKRWTTNTQTPTSIPGLLQFGYCDKTTYTNSDPSQSTTSNLNLASGIYNKSGKSLIDINKSVKDNIPSQLCCFGKDLSNIDISSSIIYFNGTFQSESGVHYRITDDNLDMGVLNNDKSCYLWFDYNINESLLPISYSVDTVLYGWLINKIPLFGVNRVIDGTVVESAMFNSPKLKFNVDYNWNNSVSLYSLYWKDYLDTIYTDNQKEVELRFFLQGVEDYNSLFRKTYLFDGCEWYLNEIIDWDKTQKGLVKCKFLKKG